MTAACNVAETGTTTAAGDVAQQYIDS